MSEHPVDFRWSEPTTFGKATTLVIIILGGGIALIMMIKHYEKAHVKSELIAQQNTLVQNSQSLYLSFHPLWELAQLHNDEFSVEEHEQIVGWMGNYIVLRTFLDFANLEINEGDLSAAADHQAKAKKLIETLSADYENLKIKRRNVNE